MMKDNSTGFSIFEFVISFCVITLVVLVIFPAVEKTIHVAHEHSVRSTAKAFQKSVEVGHQLYLLSGVEGPVKNLTRYHDGSVDFNAAGFPIGSVLSDEGDEPGSDLACLDLWNAVLGELRPDAGVDDIGQYRARYQYFNRQGRCHYYYNAGGNMSIVYEYKTGKVTYNNHYQP